MGGGAVRVFPGYLHGNNAPGSFDITILERGKTLGGHTTSFQVSDSGSPFNIDAGVQFFSKTSELTYYKMLHVERLRDHLLPCDVGISPSAP
jgi:hypothetical protein